MGFFFDILIKIFKIMLLLCCFSKILQPFIYVRFKIFSLIFNVFTFSNAIKIIFFTVMILLTFSLILIIFVCVIFFVPLAVFEVF